MTKDGRYDDCMHASEPMFKQTNALFSNIADHHINRLINGIPGHG